MLPQESFVFSDCPRSWYFDLNFTFSEDYTKYQFRIQESMVSAALPPSQASQVYMPHVKMPHLFICHAHLTSVPHIIGTSVRDRYNWGEPERADELNGIIYKE